MLREPRPAPRETHPTSSTFRRGRQRDADVLVELMESVIPEEQRPLVEVARVDYRPSWERRLEHWLRCEDESWWVCRQGENIAGAVRAVRKRGQFPHRLEVLIPPGLDGELASALVQRGLVSLGTSLRKSVESSVPNASGLLLAALEEEGFRELRVLVQMKRDLRQKIPVRSG